jgi:hypothetical protein
MAGAKIKKDKTEYQYSFPWVFPDGSQFSVYTTPKNETMVWQHSSGSHIEFKQDGSVFVRSLKDLHHHESSVGELSTDEKKAENSTSRTNVDKTFEVEGTLRFKCRKLEFEIEETGRIYAGTDLFIQANNVIAKATEGISLEPKKTLHVDTKEVRQRYISQVTENGTKEDGGGVGGARNTMNVSGNFTIRNDDPNGSISLYSKGYINIVSGMERVDIVGDYTDQPSSQAKATFTTIVKNPTQGGKGKVGNGDLYEEVANKVTLKHTQEGGDYLHEVTTGDMTEKVLQKNFTQEVAQDRKRKVQGNESVEITGTQRIKARQIYLN